MSRVPVEQTRRDSPTNFPYPHHFLATLPHATKQEYSFSIFSKDGGTQGGEYTLNVEGLLLDSKKILSISFGHEMCLPQPNQPITNPPLPTTLTSLVMQRAVLVKQSSLPVFDNTSVTLTDVIATPASMTVNLLPSGYLLSLVVDNPFAIGGYLGSVVSSIAQTFCDTFADVDPVSVVCHHSRASSALIRPLIPAFHLLHSPQLTRRNFIFTCVSNPLLADCFFVFLARNHAQHISASEFLDVAAQFSRHGELLGVAIPQTTFDSHIQQQLALQWQILTEHTSVIFPQVQKLYQQQVQSLCQLTTDAEKHLLIEQLTKVEEDKFLEKMTFEAVRAAAAVSADDAIPAAADAAPPSDRKSTRLNSSHT